jgi:hypothetical protein
MKEKIRSATLHFLNHSPLKQLTVQQEGLCVEHDLVPRLREYGGNVTSGLQSSQLQESLVVPHGLPNQLSAPRLTLRPHNNRLEGKAINNMTACQLEMTNRLPASLEWPDPQEMQPEERFVAQS